MDHCDVLNSLLPENRSFAPFILRSKGIVDVKIGQDQSA